jgi:hypothetical protein
MMYARQLSLIETSRFGVPRGGKWYRTSVEAIMENYKKPGFLLSWGIHNKSKIHGVYQDITVEEFTRLLEKVPSEHRHGYQLLPATDESPGYMILQWRGDPDPDHAILRTALSRLAARCRSRFTTMPRVVSYCSTRPVHSDPASKEFLHSYHVVARNLIFSNNHDGTMRAFFDLGMKEIRLDAYPRNTTLLLPNCRPYGSPVALTKLQVPELPSA